MNMAYWHILSAFTDFSFRHPHSPELIPPIVPSPPPLPKRRAIPRAARLRRLSDASVARALAAQKTAEERGRLVMERAIVEAEQELAVSGPIVSDEWDHLSDEDDEPPDPLVANAVPDSVVPPPLPLSTPTTASSNVAPNLPLEPDPFHIPEAYAREPPANSEDPVHSHPAVRLLYILVSWLHTHFHVPFLACHTILIVVFHIVALFGGGLATSEGYRTLPSVLHHLDVEPKFITLPVCPECFRLYPPTLKSTDLCTHCSIPIFKSTTSTSKRSQKENSRPLLQFPVKSIEAQLRDILDVDGMEDILERWRTQERQPGVYIDNFDGAVCKELKGADGRLFFENPLPPGNAELRLGLTAGVDWSVPFNSSLFRCFLTSGAQVLISSKPNRAVSHVGPNVIQYHKFTASLSLSHGKSYTGIHSAWPQRADW